MKTRENCEHTKRCGATGHYLKDGRWVRCPCLILEINKNKLGQMFDENPRRPSPLSEKLDRNLRIEGSLSIIRPHIAGALLDLSDRGNAFQVMDAYRLIEIFLEKDEELETAAPAVETDLLVLLLGFGDPRNRYLPELVVQLLTRRELIRKPTWVVTALDLVSVGTRYGEGLRSLIAKFERAGSR